MSDVEGWPAANTTALWHAVNQWRDDVESWAESAQPRLPETLRINPLREDRKWTEGILSSLGGVKIKWLPDGGGGQAWEMPWLRRKWPSDEAKILLSALHNTGRITRQEAVSMIPVKLLDCKPSHRLLDLCAAPGSKSTQLCEAIEDEGIVVANESNPGRANLLVSNCKRAALTSMVIVRHDGRHLPRCPNPGYDRILVDAPCTGNATTRKNPEIWRNWTERSGRKLMALQVALVRKAAMLLRPGGRMVYSTCSMDPIENEAVVAETLRTCDWLELVPTEIEKRCPTLIAKPGMVEWPNIVGAFGEDTFESLSEEEKGRITPPVEEEIRQDLPACRRIWSDDSGAGGFFVAAFQHVGEKDIAEALMPTEEMAEKRIRQPPPPTKNDEIPVNPDILKAVLDEWGVEYSQMFTRGSKIYTITDETKNWFYSQERMLRRGGKLPGGHWHPFQVIQAGLPTWEMRKGVLQRPTSKGMHLTAPLLTKRVHQISRNLLTEILLKGGSTREEAEADMATLEGEEGGGIVLKFVNGEVTWWLPAWLGGKLTLMLPDAQRTLLMYDMELGVA